MKERKNNRLTNFDYSSDAFYFVTSCIQEKLCYFGEVRDGKMHCNENGRIAQRQWNWLVNRYSYIESHGFIVMHNHIHAILEIDSEKPVHSRLNIESEAVGTGRDLSSIAAKIKSLSELMVPIKPPSPN